jgi:hypothetical protein
LPKEKAFDMTTATRLGGFLSLLPAINIDKRPRLVIRKTGDPVLQTIPFALFEDLKEAIFLMEYANGIRPYIFEWYHNVFLAAYNTKKAPDSEQKDGQQIITEKRKAVTTEQLIEKTYEVSNHSYTSKQILDGFVYPLINQGYIDKTKSELDRRANIYYPVIDTISKNIKLFENENSNNLSQQTKLIVEDHTIYPSKEYLISKIQEVLRYSENHDLIVIKIKDHAGNEISVEELVERYYKDPQGYFELSTKPENPFPDQSLPTIEEGKSEQQLSSTERQREQIENDNSDKQGVLDEYLGKVQTANVLQGIFSKNTKTIEIEHNISNKLFDPGKSNNLIYSNQSQTESNEQKQPSAPPTIASSTGGEPSKPSPSPQLQEQEHKRFNCFYCDQAYSSDKERVKHIGYEHPGKLYYPTPEDFEKRLS